MLSAQNTRPNAPLPAQAGASGIRAAGIATFPAAQLIPRFTVNNVNNTDPGVDAPGAGPLWLRAALFCGAA